MLTLLIGTDWIANRDAILKKIGEDVAHQNGGRVLIVPELISHDSERRLCQWAGDTCSRFAEVLSFTRLVNRVSDYCGRPVQPCLDNGGRLVAMASAASQLHSKLKAYASVETKPEFLSGLLDAVDEFKRCCITPADLLDASQKTQGSLAQKLEELSLLLENYNSICSRGKSDPRDQMTWLLEELEESDYGEKHVFYVDGFPDFTKQHINILKHLICVSENVTISLTCDKIGSEAMAFEKAGHTAAELMRFATDKGIPVSVQQIPHRDISLQHIAPCLFQGNIDVSGDSNIKTYQAESTYQECLAALENILSLAVNGVRYRDINIVCANLSAYQNILEMIMDRCHIPVYISGTTGVLDEPAVATVFAALDAALGGFEQQDVLEYLKSMLSPLDAETCDKVENYAVIWGIHGTKWTQEWKNHPDGLGKKWTEDAQNRLNELNAARMQAINPLTHLLKSFQSATTIGDEVHALYQFLTEIRYSHRLNAFAEELQARGRNREAQIIDQLWEILLAAMEQMYDTLGQTAWEYQNFVRLFKLLMSQYDVGTIPPVLDAVSVGPVNSMRCQQCKHLIVLGAEEGVLPGYSGSIGILTDHERTELRRIGIPLSGGAMDGLQAEFADIYGVFASADSTITVSCANGQPSFIYKRLSAMAGGESVCGGKLGTALANEIHAGAFLVREGASEIAEKMKITNAYREMEEHKNYVLGKVSKKAIEELYGPILNLSASQIDKQAQCRLSYFLRYGLHAKERKIAQVDPAEFGTYVHAVMEKTAHKIMQEGGFAKVSAERAVAISQKYSEEYAVEHFAELDTERINYLFKRNWAELELIVRELWEELSNSDFLPVGFEVAFGDGQTVPAIDVSGTTMPAKLRGFVDRVDAWENNECQYFRVVDYKTGKKDFDYCDIYNGYGLQMLLYLFALQDAGTDVVGSAPVPAGVQYFPARVPLVSTDGTLDDGEVELARKKLWKRKGLLLSQETVLAAMEKSDLPFRMPYSRKKDGSISGDLANSEQFKLLKRYVFRLVGKMVDDIASGNVTPNPYTRGGSHNACTYCPYGSVCHKLTVEGRRDYQAITNQQFWSDIEKEVGKYGG